MCKNTQNINFYVQNCTIAGREVTSQTFIVHNLFFIFFGGIPLYRTTKISSDIFLPVFLPLMTYIELVIDNKNIWDTQVWNLNSIHIFIVHVTCHIVKCQTWHVKLRCYWVLYSTSYSWWSVSIQSIVTFNWRQFL